MEEIMVSICCLAYNHERYIRQCLDGFLMQKCDFKFEVLIHDDASPDHTADIIREYEKKYPDIIKPIYQTENKYSKGEDVSKYNISRAKGRYIAFCEGDDYWTDSNKLQMQFDALEDNTDCFFCTHMVKAVDERGDPLPKTYPLPKYGIKTGVLSSVQFLEYECKESYSFQTSSYFCNSEYIKKLYNERPNFTRIMNIVDLCIMLYMANCGNVFYYDNPMSCYRIGSASSVERRKNYAFSEESMIKYHSQSYKMIMEFDKYSNYKFHKLCVKKIKTSKFCIASNYGNYREMVKPKYRYLLKDYSKKAQLKIYLTSIFPKLISKHDKRKESV